MTKNTEDNTTLVSFQDLNVVELFDPETGTAAQLLTKISDIALSEVPDITTATGRARVASLSRRVRTTKARLDDLRKAHKAEAQQIVQSIDGVGKTIRDGLDQLAKSVREPLTQWEEIEAAKKAAFDEFLELMKSEQEPRHGETLDQLHGRLERVESAKVEQIEDEQQQAIALKAKYAAAGAIKTIIDTEEQRQAEVARVAEERGELERQRAELERQKQELAEAQVAARAESTPQQDAKPQALDHPASEPLPDGVLVTSQAENDAEREAKRSTHQSIVATLVADYGMDDTLAMQFVKDVVTGRIEGLAVVYPRAKYAA